MHITLVIVLLVLHKSSAIIYSLNGHVRNHYNICKVTWYTEYYKMPALYGLDDFEACMSETGGTYCVVDADLSSGANSELMGMIQEYSNHKLKHFNHTQIHRGVCVTRTCKNFLLNRESNKISDLEATLGACINDSLSTNYGLNAKLANILYCKYEGEKVKIDTSDIVVAVVYLILIMLNTFGTLYDILMSKKDTKSGNPYLLAFSLRRNWKRMIAPSNGGSEPRLERLRLFHGMRTMTLICVFFSHAALIMSYSYVANPLYIERSYEDPLKQILFNGSLVIHTFFVMSSFLLAYNFQLHAEKHRVTWLDLPKGILLRWLRVTPTYALVLATIATWMRHAYTGPLWDLVVSSEAVACRQYWWAQLLYVNNYVYADAFCMPQTWYLAADIQLFCLGLVVCVAVRTLRARMWTLAALFVAALLIVAGHTYFQDLEAVVMQSPETYRNLYASDATFRLLYIRGHTNLSTYVIGLAGGLLTYYWQTEGKDWQQFKKHRWVVWLLFPAGVAVILSGGLFYSDGGRAPVAFRVLYATLYKPLFQFLVVSIMISCIFKFESIYRCLIEWRGFTWTGRVSYSAFLLHTLLQRGLLGLATQPTHMTDFYVVSVLASSIFLSYACAGALWLCAEAPAGALTRALLAAPPRSTAPRPLREATKF